MTGHILKFLSTLSLRRATKFEGINFWQSIISIHALLAESDLVNSRLSYVFFGFLSTLSLRRATQIPKHPQAADLDFYPRSPCGERPHAIKPSPRSIEISIHALLAESDDAPVASPTIIADFYPRSPCGERRAAVFKPPPFCRISIHALLAESDSAMWTFQHGFTDFYPRSPCGERHSATTSAKTRQSDFYPRSPCGERPHGQKTKVLRSVFLSTLSLRRATLAA